MSMSIPTTTITTLIEALEDEATASRFRTRARKAASFVARKLGAAGVRNHRLAPEAPAVRVPAHTAHVEAPQRPLLCSTTGLTRPQIKGALTKAFTARADRTLWLGGQVGIMAREPQDQDHRGGSVWAANRRPSELRRDLLRAA